MDGQLEHLAVRVVGQVSTRFIGANIMTKSRRRLACSFVWHIFRGSFGAVLCWSRNREPNEEDQGWSGGYRSGKATSRYFGPGVRHDLNHRQREVRPRIRVRRPDESITIWITDGSQVR